MSEFFDFEVYASDAAPVREVDQGHLVEVAWTVTAPTGAKSSGVKRVQITDDMDAVVQLGLLVTPDPIPGYTGGYALAPDLAAEVATRAAADTALDGRVDALLEETLPDGIVVMPYARDGIGAVTGVRRILDNAADRALATRHASVPALWTLQP